ncbi:TetR/AcrR family transcriptional regulator [Albibacillus kandeliae]|uniref:TetR/AcrR family transcriptional regulator n=1 Tax=Albibacillus kandeliae TaxID=2174228 RepID=UPI000D69C862|nr:TetR/AcrR family transcriptional regulator [Albibacillus kandeliae]
MNERPQSTKERLIRTASELFRLRGYSGVGVAEILQKAGAPKGSLYHHFPEGKADLARAAANWASDGMLRTIAASFEPATSFGEGARTLCHKLAKLSDMSGEWGSCPVSGALFDGPDNEAFRALTNHLFEGWIAELEHHAQRLGATPDAARQKAEHLFMLLEGGWTLARSRSDSDVLRTLPVPA